MTPVNKAFHRWLAAEQDVHDANNLLLWAIRSGEPAFEEQQLKVVKQLRVDASTLLRDYLRVIAAHTVTVGSRKLPTSSAPSVNEHLQEVLPADRT